MPTLIPLLRAAINSAKRRQELFLLLTVFAGLLTSLVYASALESAFSLVATAGAADNSGTDYTALSEQATEHLPSLIMGQLGLMVVAGFLLPLWARAASPAGLLPWDGSPAFFLRRGMLGFRHLITAALLTLASLVFIFVTATALGFVGGSTSGFGIVLALTVSIWVSIVFSAGANTAIIAAATDQQMTFRDALARNKTFLRPIAGSLAVIWFASILIDAALEPALTGLIGADTGFQYRALAFLKGALGFITAALHISVLYNIPGLFRTDTQA